MCVFKLTDGTDRSCVLTDMHLVANNFWGKEDAGVSPLLERMHNAKVTADELKVFYSGPSQKISECGVH